MMSARKEKNHGREMAMAESFDLGGYLERIGYEGEAAPTWETLAELHRRHVMTFPFENINPLMGWPVPLDIGELQAKFVAGGRGGYCFEQNLLFKAALEAVGFEVTGLAARVLAGRPPGSLPARTHMLLRVETGGASYLADVGFGGNTLTEPIRLEAGTVQPTSHDNRRLLFAGGEYTMEAQILGEWRTLYRFDLTPHHLPDYEVSNWYVSTHPDSHFTKRLSAARVWPKGRYTLRSNEFGEHRVDGPTQRRIIPTLSELRSILEEVFLINLPERQDLNEKLRSLIQGEPA